MKNTTRAIPVRGSSLSLLAVGAGAVAALLSACGDPVDHELGSALTPSNEASSASDASSSEAASASEPRVDPAPRECAAPFQACGGVLAGEWTVAGTCDVESRGRAALRRWGASFMGLDASLCPDAAELATGWSGTLRFQDGVLFDERQRSDRFALDLTPACLGAARGEPVALDRFDAECRALGAGCVPGDGVCRCSAQRDAPVATSGPYGVLGTDVAVARAEGPPVRIDYCVQGSALHWTDAVTGQHLVFRRTSVVPPLAGDPVDVPR